MKAYQNLPKHFDGYDDTVPLRVTLLPLSDISGKEAALLKALNDALIQDALNTLQTLEQIQASAYDLIGTDICHKFPQFKARVSAFKDSVKLFNDIFKKRLQKLLPRMRGTDEEDALLAESELRDFLIHSQKGPFSLSLLQNWIEIKKKEENLLAKVIKSAQREAEFDQQRILHIEEGKKFLIGLEINAFDDESDSYLIGLKELVDSLSKGDENSNYTGQMEFKSDSFLTNAADDIMSHVRCFNEYPSINDQIQFSILSAKSNENQSPVQFVLKDAENGKKFFQECLARSPYEPIIKSISATTSEIAWTEPLMFPLNALGYKIVIKIEGGNDDKKIFETKKTSLFLENLKPGNTYEVDISARLAIPGILTPNCTLKLKTLPTGPVSFELVNHNVLQIQKPSIIGLGIEIEKYEIKVTGELLNDINLNSLSSELSKLEWKMNFIKAGQTYHIEIVPFTNQGHGQKLAEKKEAPDIDGIAVEKIEAILEEIGKLEKVYKAWKTILENLITEKDNIFRQHDISFTYWSGKLMKMKDFRIKFQEWIEILIESDENNKQYGIEHVSKNLLHEDYLKKFPKWMNLNGLKEDKIHHSVEDLVKILAVSQNDCMLDDEYQNFCAYLDNLKISFQQHEKWYQFALLLALLEPLGYNKDVEIFKKRTANPQELRKVITTYFIEKDPSKEENIYHILKMAYESSTSKSEVKTFLDVLQQHDIMFDKKNEIEEIIHDDETENVPKEIEFDYLDSNVKAEPTKESMIKPLKYLQKFQDCLSFFKTKEDQVFTHNSLFAIHLPEKSNSDIVEYLRKLFMLDSDCIQIASSTEKTDSAEATENDDLFSDSEDEETAKNDNAGSFTSPDLTLCAIIASDNFFVQEVYEKMASCQLAVPIIRPDSSQDDQYVFGLWATRTIKKKWLDSREGSHESLVTSVPMPVVAFFRLGDLIDSKSVVVNNFVSAAVKCQSHNFFSNVAINQKPQLNTGIVEALWVCPEGRKDGKINDVFCAYNLRGDARQHSPQTKTLKEVASVVVIFIRSKSDLSKEEKDELSNSSTPIILVDQDAKGRSLISPKQILSHILCMFLDAQDSGV